jgi:hypothetical protein
LDQTSYTPTLVFGFLAKRANFPGSARQRLFDRLHPVIPPKFVQWDTMAISDEEWPVRYLHSCLNGPGVKPLSLTKPAEYIAGILYPVAHRNAVIIFELAFT